MERAICLKLGTIVAIFVLGLFIGSNLGIMLLCVMQVAGDADRRQYYMLNGLRKQQENVCQDNKSPS